MKSRLSMFGKEKMQKMFIYGCILVVIFFLLYYLYLQYQPIDKEDFKNQKKKVPGMIDANIQIIGNPAYQGYLDYKCVSGLKNFVSYYLTTQIKKDDKKVENTTPTQVPLVECNKLFHFKMKNSTPQFWSYIVLKNENMDTQKNIVPLVMEILFSESSKYYVDIPTNVYEEPLTLNLPNSESVDVIKRDDINILYRDETKLRIILRNGPIAIPLVLKEKSKQKFSYDVDVNHIYGKSDLLKENRLAKKSIFHIEKCMYLGDDKNVDEKMRKQYYCKPSKYKLCSNQGSSTTILNKDFSGYPLDKCIITKEKKISCPYESLPRGLQGCKYPKSDISGFDNELSGLYSDDVSGVDILKNNPRVVCSPNALQLC